MATLSTAALASIQSAIDLLCKGSAHETPLSEDVIQRLAPVVAELAGVTSGGAYEVFRDNPYSALISLVALRWEGVLSTEQSRQLGQAILLMIAGQAYETPLAEDVIARLAPVAEATGYLTRGGFYEAARDNPVSVFLKWVLFLREDSPSAPLAPPASPCELPTAPGSLSANVVSGYGYLEWSLVNGATGYNIKRSLVPGGPYDIIGTAVGEPLVAYTDATVVEGTPYYYVLSSTNSCGESETNSVEASLIWVS